MGSLSEFFVGDTAVEHMKCRVLTAWGACSHKKMVAASAVTAFWNLSSVKTRIFTGNFDGFSAFLTCYKIELVSKAT